MGSTSQVAVQVEEVVVAGWTPEKELLGKPHVGLQGVELIQITACLGPVTWNGGVTIPAYHQQNLLCLINSLSIFELKHSNTIFSKSSAQWEREREIKRERKRKDIIFNDIIGTCDEIWTVGPENIHTNRIFHHLWGSIILTVNFAWGSIFTFPIPNTLTLLRLSKQCCRFAIIIKILQVKNNYCKQTLILDDFT